MLLKTNQLTKMNTTGLLPSPVVFWRKDKNINDEMASQLHTLHKLSIYSLKNDFDEIVLSNWADIPKEFYLKSIPQYHSFYTFYDENETMIGFAGFPVAGYLKLFYFHPSYQRNKYGNICLKFIEHDNNTNKNRCIGLKAHNSAVGFYLKQGYNVIRDEILKLNESFIKVKVMEKTI